MNIENEGDLDEALKKCNSFLEKQEQERLKELGLKLKENDNYGQGCT